MPARLGVHADDSLVGTAVARSSAGTLKTTQLSQIGTGVGSRERSLKTLLDIMASHNEPENATRDFPFLQTGVRESSAGCSTRQSCSFRNVGIRRSTADPDATGQEVQAKFDQSALPVRSPLPNGQPSTRLAPASTANSVAATLPSPFIVVRMQGQHTGHAALLRWLDTYSTSSGPKTFGVVIFPRRSRLVIIRMFRRQLDDVDRRVAHTSTAYSARCR